MDKMCVYCVNPQVLYTRKTMFTCFFTCLAAAAGESCSGTGKFRERYPSPLRRPRRRVGMQDRFPGVRGKVGCGRLVHRTRCRRCSFPREGDDGPLPSGTGPKGSQGPACRWVGGWRNRPRGRSFRRGDFPKGRRIGTDPAFTGLESGTSAAGEPQTSHRRMPERARPFDRSSRLSLGMR